MNRFLFSTTEKNSKFENSSFEKHTCQKSVEMSQKSYAARVYQLNTVAMRV